MSNFAVSVDTDNTDNIEIYTHDIFRLADEYIDIYLNGTKDKDVLKSEFKSIIYYIRHRIPKIDNNNIELLDYIFCNVYVELCAKCNIIPTIEAFSWLVSINPNTFSAWKNGEYRKLNPKYSLTAQKWSNICKGQLIYELTQSKGGDINRIFIAKAIHGLAETAPVPAAHVNTLNLDNTQLAARLGDRLETVEATAIEDQGLNTKSEG